MKKIFQSDYKDDIISDVTEFLEQLPTFTGNGYVVIVEIIENNI